MTCIHQDIALPMKKESGIRATSKQKYMYLIKYVCLHSWNFQHILVSERIIPIFEMN